MIQKSAREVWILPTAVFLHRLRPPQNQLDCRPGGRRGPAVPTSLVLRACVRPSGPFSAPLGRWTPTPGSFPALLRPLLTPRHGRQRCRRQFRPVARSAHAEVSPGKGGDFRDTTPGFTCDADTRTSLCGASSSASPASQPVSVHGLVVLTPASFPPGLAAAQLPSSDAFVLIGILHRGLSPRQFTPMPGTHQPPLQTPASGTPAAEAPVAPPPGIAGR